MRLSKFEIKLIWGLILIPLNIYLLFYVDIIGDKDYITTILALTAIFCGAFLLIWLIELNDNINDCLISKHKIIFNKYDIIEVKKLQLWFIIPYWYSFNYEFHKYETQNMFGAKYSNYFKTDVKCQTEEEAISIINKDKITIKKNRDNFFKRPNKKVIKVKYL